MIDFIIDNAAEIISYFAIVATISPFLISRVVSDKNILTTFSKIRDLAGSTNTKHIDIIASINNINNIIEKVQNDWDENIKLINETILEFTQSELYTKMLLGLSQLDEFNQVLQNKEDTIQDLKITIKEINKKLG